MEIALVIAGFFFFFSDKHPRGNLNIGGDRALKHVRVQRTKERFYSVFSRVAEW